MVPQEIGQALQHHEHRHSSQGQKKIRRSLASGFGGCNGSRRKLSSCTQVTVSCFAVSFACHVTALFACRLPACSLSYLRCLRPPAQNWASRLTAEATWHGMIRAPDVCSTNKTGSAKKGPHSMQTKLPVRSSSQQLFSAAILSFSQLSSC